MSLSACSCLNAPTSGVAWIDDACADAVALARHAPGGVAWVVVVAPLEVPDSPLEPFAAAGTPRTLLWDPAAGTWHLSLGTAETIIADGPGRALHLAAAQARVDALCVVRSSVADAAAAPQWRVAWSFEEHALPAGHWGHRLPAASLVLPRRLLWRDAAGRGWEQLALRVSAEDEPGAVSVTLGAPVGATDHGTPAPWPTLSDDYAEQVDDAVSLIADGVMRKVVLARAIDATTPHQAARILGNLAADLPVGTTVYAHDLDDGGLFLGATPEALFELDGDHLRTMALAGSIARGASDAEDLARAGELLASTKQRKEHQLVVEHLVQQLRPRCAHFPLPTGPHHRTVRDLIHLETAISARTLGGEALDLLAALHPTPAVCGLPIATARHYIARHERLARGLYSGVLGLIGPRSARLSVPLRGGILAATGGRIRLFAGAGIVETSDPQAELAETEAKLRTMRRAIS